MLFWNNMYFQDSGSPFMSQLHQFHDHTLVISLIVVSFVLFWGLSVILNHFSSRYLTDNQLWESLWTIFPALILMVIIFPSLGLLYVLDELNSPELTVKITGNQWFWSYEYSDFPEISFNSYFLPQEQSVANFPRLLEVDNRLTFPVDTSVRLLVTAADVIHSWSVPSLGVKIDAVPGRLNQTSTYLDRTGLFYGQCSEICGANHSFMPISMESVSHKHFCSFLGVG